MLRAMYQYSRHPDLAPDIIWRPRWQYDVADTALTLHGEQLVSLHDRVDGGWFARLHGDGGFDAPIVTRPCTSFDAGRHGAELWVLRHELELRAMVERKLRWIQENVALAPPGGRRMDLEMLDRKGARRMAEFEQRRR